MSGKKLIHILGAGQWQLPTICLAKSLGYRVLVTDMYDERPGYALADEFEVADIADKDRTLEIASQHRIDGIICDTTDVGVPTMAYVAEKLNLPGIGYETSLNFTNKFRMRTLTSKAGVPSPPFYLVSSFEEFRSAVSDIGIPCVVKPVDSQSSRGVHIIRGTDKLRSLYSEAIMFSRQRQALVEGFLDGIEVTVEGCSVDGQAFVIGISDKDHFQHRPEVASRLTYPADLPPHLLTRIREVNAAVVSALGLCTGITHAEYMVVNGEIYLIEIAARGAGSCVYSDIVPHLAGLPIPRFYLDFLMGGRQLFQPNSLKRAANLAFFQFPSGRVTSISGLDDASSIPGVKQILLEFSVGDELSPPEDDRSRPGLVVILGQTRSEVLASTESVFQTLKVETCAR